MLKKTIFTALCELNLAKCALQFNKPSENALIGKLLSASLYDYKYITSKIFDELLALK